MTLNQRIFLISLKYFYLKLNLIFSALVYSQIDSGKQNLYDGEEVHEPLFIKKHAYKTGTEFFPSLTKRFGSTSGSSAGSSSSSGAGQSGSYSSSSSWSSSSSYNGGQSGYQQQPQLAQYAGYQPTAIPLASFAEKVCTTKPKSIPNASTQCSLVSKTCNVQCLKDYQLPNGETKAKMYCNNGDWALENMEWTDKLACERKQIDLLLLFI